MGSNDSSLSGEDSPSPGPESKHWLGPLLRLRGSPECIASGVAIGAFVAFTPTLGAQMLLAAALATAAGASRPAALVPVWITNPATIVPIYAFTYRVGGAMLPGPAAEGVASRLADAVGVLKEVDPWRLDLHFAAFAGVGTQVFVILAVGGLVVGVLAAAISYLIALRLIRIGHAELAAMSARAKQRKAGT